MTSPNPARAAILELLGHMLAPREYEPGHFTRLGWRLASTDDFILLKNLQAALAALDDGKVAPLLQSVKHGGGRRHSKQQWKKKILIAAHYRALRKRGCDADEAKARTLMLSKGLRVDRRTKATGTWETTWDGWAKKADQAQFEKLVEDLVHAKDPADEVRNQANIIDDIDDAWRHAIPNTK